MTEQYGRLIPSRASDPPTSHAAEQHIIVSASNQRGIILGAYETAQGGLTDDEASARAPGVSAFSCYWKRCSELREAGLIADTGRTRKGGAGVERMVCEITDTGRRAVRRAAEGQSVRVPI